MMIEAKHLVTLGRLYAAAKQLSLKVVSWRALEESKKLGMIEDGRVDITIGRYNSAVAWFSENWPEGVEWPHEVPRPERARAAQ